MYNFLAFLPGGLSEASEDAFADGQFLAQACLSKLDTIDNPEQFPPRLLILLASPAYLATADAQSLVDGVHRTFARRGYENIALIGSTVSAVFFERAVHERGALLICLASRMLEAHVVARPAARNQVEAAAEELLNKLALNFTSQGDDPNPLVNRMLLTFLPGFGAPDAGATYPAPDLHLALLQKVRARVPIIGGGSSAGRRDLPGLQFANRAVYVDALVGARLTTGFPFTSSIGHGLTPTGRVFQVKDITDDRRTVFAFHQGTAMEALGLQPEEKATLGELSLDHDPVVNVARAAADGAVQMLRNVGRSGYLEELLPEPGQMRREAKDLIEWSLRRLRVEHPVGCLGIHCSARKELNLTIDEMTDDVAALLHGAPYVGGFFEGEIGLGQTGRSLFGNWCVATVTFGDEMRLRTPFYQGFQAIDEYTSKLAEMLEKTTRNATIEEAMKHSLKLITNVGYAGAMISLVLDHQGSRWVVARQTEGAHFAGVQKNAAVPFHPGSFLGQVAEGARARLICDARELAPADLPGSAESKAISQYVIPLRKWSGEVIGFLQIDLGDIRYRQCIQGTEQRVLDGVGALIESNMVRLIVRKQTLIANQMEEILKGGQIGQMTTTLQQALQLFLEQTLKLLDFEMGHIRLYCPENHTLVMTAGCGAYYDVMRQQRWKIPLHDDSPTCATFLCDEVMVVNDAKQDAWFQELHAQHRADATIDAALAQVGSFANVMIRGEKGKPIGTINLIARQPWAFTRAKIHALEVINQHLGYLVDLYQQRGNMQFLSQVNTDFVRNANFKDPLETMNQAVARCCKAANAEIAGLFLWDPEIKQFILRAQSGWANPAWVDAARYAENERWKGKVTVSSRPQYLPNLLEHFAAEGIPPNEHYARQVFGDDLRPDYVVEAMGLPLRLKDRPLGVLVLYRRVRPAQMGCDGGFTTTDPNVLQEASDNLATMVSAQLYFLRVLWQQDELKRHRAACEMLEAGGQKYSLEELLCLAMTTHFHATRASLYLVDASAETPTLAWAAGLRRREQETLSLHEQPPDDLLWQALHQRRITEHYHYVPPAERINPDVVKSHGLVDRVCLPLRKGKQVIGVLDLHWGTKRTRVRPMMALHNADLLTKLGKELGACYVRQHELKEKAKAQEALQTMGVMQFQSAHRLLNLAQDLCAMPNLLRQARDAETLQLRVDQLAKLLDSTAERIKRPMEIARRVKNIKPQGFKLRHLLEEVLEEPEIETQCNVEVHLHVVPESLQVWIDQDLAREAFRNVIHNAIKAMPDGGTLKIKANQSKDRHEAHIVFEDNGVGMSKEEINVALSGFASTQGSTGLGVLVSLLLIRAGNGNLKIRSQKGVGTRVFIHLPLEPLPSEEEETA